MLLFKKVCYKGVRGWGNWVMDIKEGTGAQDVMSTGYKTDESLNSTSETNKTVYVN